MRLVIGIDNKVCRISSLSTKKKKKTEKGKMTTTKIFQGFLFKQKPVLFYSPTLNAQSTTSLEKVKCPLETRFKLYYNLNPTFF